MNFILKSADFSYGAVKLSDLPEVDYPEIAVLGRSNVGKSSLINRLTNRKKLARVSNTPGRTQQANLFTLRYDSSSGANQLLALVDLPGYGFAKVSKGKKERFLELVASYLREREALKAVVLLNDCRRDPGEEELFIQEHLFESDIPCIITLTKCDKLTRNELASRRKSLATQFRLEPEDLVVTGKESPLDTFWEKVLPLL